MRLAFLAMAALGCADDPEAASGYALGPVVATRIAELEPASSAIAPPPESSEEDAEAVEGLVATLPDVRGRMRNATLAGARELGARAVAPLTAILTDETRPEADRLAAAELLGEIEHPAAAEALLAGLETSRSAPLRRVATWAVGRTGQDHALPRLVLRLKYESDRQAFVWVADALAALGNYAGADALADLARSEADEPSVRELAAARLAEIAAEAGVADGPALVAAWHSSEAAARLPGREPSDALRWLVWRTIAELSSERFQLRGVDDARFVLSRLGPWAVGPLTEALHDEDLGVRLHVTQVLARMGRRAAAAGPPLVEALREPAVAPSAAQALGSVGPAGALEPLVAATAPDRSYELRAAATRGLGLLGEPAAAERLASLLADRGEPADLRLTAAAALVGVGAGDRAARTLLDELAGGAVDPAAAEAALEEWLVRGTHEERPGFAGALEAWRQHTPPPNLIPTASEARARRQARAKDLARRLDALVG